MQPSRRVTIEDVAARAGVHAGTVSRALNRPEQVAPATRERIEAIVQELDFVPNRAARGLITGRTDNVAVIVPDITNPTFAALVRAAGRAARDADLQLLLVDTGEHAEEEVRAARTLAHEVDGFVVLSPRRLHRELGALGSTPAVFVNRPVRGRASVVIRTARAVDDAVRHLVGHGHVGLAYLGGPKGSWAATERRDAARRTSRDTGIAMHEVTVGAPTFEAAASTADAILATGASAVLAFNGQMALGVIAGLAQRGIAVPGDVSVVGGDDVPMAAMTAPPLTALSVPTGEAGATAVELLRSDGPSVELAGTLVVRGSTGPVTS
ncbi:MAG TPA: LacI family DNA-binding transcriptional regulator [Acidimicrobiales bacterium]